MKPSSTDTELQTSQDSSLATEADGMSSRRALVRDGLMTIKEAAEFLSVSRTKLYDLMNRGEISWRKIGRARRVPRRAVEEFAARALRGGRLLPGKEPGDA